MGDRFRQTGFNYGQNQGQWSAPSKTGSDSRFPNKRPTTFYQNESEPSNKLSRLSGLAENKEIKAEIISPDSPEPAENSDEVDIVSKLFPANQPKTFICRLCNNDTFFKNETDFDIHLTVIHFREKLLKKIQEPFRCLSCGYIPLQSIPLEDQSEDLLMHYGCKEHLSQLYYREEVSRLPQLKSEEKEPEAITIVCKLCKSSFDTERLFVRHISLRHFPKQLCDDLPKSEPFICPFIDCGQEKFTIHNLMLHYGCEHNISMELYQKETRANNSAELKKPEPVLTPLTSTSSCSPLFTSYMKKVSSKRSSLLGPAPNQDQTPSASPPAVASGNSSIKSKLQPAPSKPKDNTFDLFAPQFSCEFCPEKKLKFSAKKSLKYHILFSHLFTNLPQTGPCECPICFNKFSIKNVFASHFLDKHFEEYMKSKSNRIEEKSKSAASSHPKSSEKHKSSSSKDKTKSSSKEEPREKSKSGSRQDDYNSKSKSSSKVDSNEESKSSSGSKKHKSHSSSKHSSSSSKKSSSSSSTKTEDKQKSKEGQTTEKKTSESEKNEETPIPASRVRQTIHSSFARQVSSASTPNPTARQKLLENWKKDSIDSQRFEIEQLKEKIHEMETVHSEALKKKAEEFERWITQKEKALEEEHLKRKSAEEKLEEISVVSAETELQLVQHQSRNKTLQAELEEQTNLCQQAFTDKKRQEKDLVDLRAELLRIQSMSDEKSEDLKVLNDQFSEKVSQINELEDNVKDLKSSEEKTKLEFEKQIGRLDKSAEAQAKKIEKLTEEKKTKMAQIKELTKKHNEAEAELKSQISELNLQIKQLNSKINTQKNALEKSAKTEMKRLEKDHDKIGKQLEDYEAQLIERNQVIEKLENRKDGLLDSLIHIQKLMQGFEVLITDKNEKLIEQEGKIADLEAIVEESVDKVSKLKVVEKEKKDLTKQVKQLQLTLQDWETRQFTNVKLISGLEKTKAALEKKVKDFEENHTGAEDELYEMSTQIRQLEKEVKRLNETIANIETELSQTKNRLHSKSNELALSAAKIEELEQKIRDLEREVRNKANFSEDVHQLKQVISNKEAELAHLRLTLNNLKTQFNQLRSNSSKTEEQLKTLQSSNAKFETEYSMAVSQIETLKKALRDAHVELSKREKQLVTLKEIVQKDANSLSSIQQVMSSDTSEAGSSSSLQQFSQIIDNLNHCLQKDVKAQIDGFIKVKTEPIDETDETPTLNPDSEASIRIDTEKQIVLNVPGSFALVTPVKEEPIIPNPATFCNDDIAEHSDNDEVAENENRNLAGEETEFLNGFSLQASHLGSLSIFNANVPPQPTPSISPASKSLKKKRCQLPDVTGQHFPDEDTTVCGLCGQFDPPHSDDAAKTKVYTTEWVGCDCNQWFHKPCTKLQRFTSLFSCRSVKMKCLGGHVPKKGRKSAKKQKTMSTEADDINMTVVHR